MLIALDKILCRFIKNIPLRWVLTIPFVLPTIGAVVLVGYLSFQNGQAAVEDLGSRLAAQTNDRVAQELRTYLQTPTLINRLNVDAVEQGQLDLQNVPALESALFNRLQQFEQVSTVLFVSPEGMFRLAERLPDFYLGLSDPPQPNQLAIYRLDQQGNRQELVYVEKNLNVRRDRPWYQRAVTTGEPGWSPIAQYGTFEALALDASRPVYDHQRLLGVFAVHIRLDYLSEFLRGLDISRAGQIMILDRNGGLIATSAQEQLYKVTGKIGAGPKAYSQVRQLQIDESQSELTRSLGQYFREHPDSLHSLTQPQSLILRHQGERQYVKVTPFQDRYGLDWRIVTVIPQSHFLSTIQFNTRTTVLLSLLTLITAIAVGLAATNNITVRLSELNRVSRELALGNLAQRLPIDGSICEFNELAQAFNRMADQLQFSFDRLKAALAESEEKFTIIFHSNPDPLALIAIPAGRCVEANESFLNWLEYCHTELIGQRFLDLQVWSQVEEQTYWQQVIEQQGRVRNLEVRLRTRSGEVKTALVSAELIEINQNSYLLGVVRDISDRKAAELALQRSEAALLQAQRIAHIGSWELDLETQKMTWSEELFRILGCDPSQPEPAYAELPEMMPVEDWHELAIAVERAIAEGTSYEVEHRIQRPDGTIRTIVSKGQVICNDQQQVIKLCGTALDITERKQTEAALQASETRFRQLAEAVRQGFFIFETESRQYSYVNPAYEEIMGIQGEFAAQGSLQGTSHWLNHIHPDDRPQIEAALQQEKQGQNFDEEYRFIHPNGEIRWLRSQAFPLRDATGTICRIAGTVEDITERKHLEESLRSQAEEERLLATITQTIRQSLDLDQILATTVIEVQQTLNADRVLIFQLHADGSGQVIQEAVAPAYPVTEKLRWEDEHFPEDCYEYYRQGNLRIVPDIAADQWASCLTDFLQEMGVKSKVVVPIVRICDDGVNRVWGLLVLHACATYRQWQQTEVNFLQQICNQLAIAIGQANLYQQLQERETLLRSIGNNLPKGFIYQFIHDPEKGFYFSYVSAGVEQLIGVKPEVIMQNPNYLHDRVIGPDRLLCERLTQESLNNLSVFEMQMRKRTERGELQWSSVRSVPRRFADGRTVWDGIEVDITDLKRVEEALRTSEERFRRAFDDAPIGISLVSTTGQFLKANTYYCNLLGYSEAELLQLTFQELTHPADLAADLAGHHRMLAGDIRSYQVEKRYITKQETVVPVLLNVVSVQDEQEQPLYFIGQIQDMRERRKINQMKDEFISVVSHELRTPLTSIQGALGILKSGIFSDRPERASQMLHIATSNCERLERLVNDILTLERLESGKVQLVMEHCLVADLMQQAVDSVQAIADQAGITLAFSLLESTLWAAPDAIIQALTNLLSNAIKFSAVGDTVWFTASIGAATEAGSGPSPVNELCFTVKDQGRGIPADKLDLIFEQFQQVDVSDSRKKGGTGLGLAICKTIVQQHRGKIWVESTLNEGSAFYVVLPLTQASPEQTLDFPNEQYQANLNCG
jgi:PAS domain S-box-containing protein